MIRRVLTTMAAALLLVAISYALGYLAARDASTTVIPDCPYEDSCRADYRSDGWHIEPREEPRP